MINHKDAMMSQFHGITVSQFQSGNTGMDYSTLVASILLEITKMLLIISDTIMKYCRNLVDGRQHRVAEPPGAKDRIG